VGDQDTGSPGRPVFSGLHVPGETGERRATTRPSCKLPAALSFKSASFAPAEMSNIAP